MTTRFDERAKTLTEILAGQHVYAMTQERWLDFEVILPAGYDLTDYTLIGKQELERLMILAYEAGRRSREVADPNDPAKDDPRLAEYKPFGHDHNIPF